MEQSIKELEGQKVRIVSVGVPDPITADVISVDEQFLWCSMGTGKTVFPWATLVRVTILNP
jgi:hypothetical protein